MPCSSTWKRLRRVHSGRPLRCPCGYWFLWRLYSPHLCWRWGAPQILLGWWKHYNCCPILFQLAQFCQIEVENHQPSIKDQSMLYTSWRWNTKKWIVDSAYIIWRNTKYHALCLEGAQRFQIGDNDHFPKTSGITCAHLLHHVTSSDSNVTSDPQKTRWRGVSLTIYPM